MIQNVIKWIDKTFIHLPFFLKQYWRYSVKESDKALADECDKKCLDKKRQEAGAEIENNFFQWISFAYFIISKKKKYFVQK